MAVTRDLFWTDYTDFDTKNASFYGDDFICKSKDIRDVNIHLWHQKYSLYCTKVLGFAVCRVTSKVLGIGVAERSWGNINTIKYVKDLLSAVMYQRNIVMFIHLPVLNHLESNNIIRVKTLMSIVPVTIVMNMMMLLINSWKNGVCKKYFQIN